MRSLMKKFSQSAPTSCRIASGAKFNLKIGLIQNLYGIFWITIQNLYIIFWISPKKPQRKTEASTKPAKQKHRFFKSTSQRVKESTRQQDNETTSSFRFSSIDVSTTLVGTCLRLVMKHQPTDSQTCRGATLCARRHKHPHK